MGSKHRNLSPFPPNYIAITFRPTDELWICQGPPNFIEFVHSLLRYIWPKYEHQERHCHAPEKRKQRKETQLRSTLKNSVFRIPANPFNLLPNHQSTETSESTYKFISLLVAFLYSMDYEIVSAGHFIRGTEASTCLFRCTIDYDSLASKNSLKKDCQIHTLGSFTPFSVKQMNAVDFEFAKKMLVVGFEGWNRLYFINITHKLATDLVSELGSVWPENVKFHKIGTSDSSDHKNGRKESKSEEEIDKHLSYLVEFEGHPWDSYKVYSELTPYLILTLIRVLDQAGYKYESRANVRGLLDTVFFVKQDSPPPGVENIARICFSLCHQNILRVYGGTPKFCAWMGQLLQQLWISGVSSKKEVLISQLLSKNNGSSSINDLHFTEVKFNGTPFCIPEWNKDNFLAAQYMIGRLVGVLSLVEWRLSASMNVYTSPYDKSLLIFEKDLNTTEEEILVDLEVVELEVKSESDGYEGNVKNYDLLRPICFTSYDVDRLCILGGSRHFLLNFNDLFLRLFDNSCSAHGLFSRCRCRNKDNETKNHSTEFQDANGAISDNWIVSHQSYTPELLHKLFLGSGHSILCLLSPIHDNIALSAIADLDPSNVLEYATNYQMWAPNICWPPKMFHKAKKRAKKFFHMSQIPLAVLCWINEFINQLGSPEFIKSQSDQGERSALDEVEEVTPLKQSLKQRVLAKPYKRVLVTCLDCASTVRNGPPAWIYLIREPNQQVVMESKE
ncbi:unnamed protein product [Rodentolepis nana]|uniref:Anaphase-promoting complex subunit 1 n=1 Tax=Rodentolepis nana TaxID=102285 RepID=A0A0R3TUC6_RODNA|nr:unnamed protein product [Rodentolepis nana]